MGWKIHQMDMKTTFLKEAPRAWYTHIDSYLQGLDFTKSKVDASLHYITIGGLPLILVLYVDDLIFTRVDSLIRDYKADLEREFEMKGIGLMCYFLGLEVWQGDGDIFLGQGKYTTEVLKRFHMQDCRPMTTHLVTNWRKTDYHRVERVEATLYKKLIRSLMYLVNTKPDICFAVNQLSQFMMDPTRVHWVAVKHVLRYLKGTTDYGLWYKNVDRMRLEGYKDADWAGSSVGQKSI
eukprot:PITA_17698